MLCMFKDIRMPVSPSYILYILYFYSVKLGNLQILSNTLLSGTFLTQEKKRVHT